MEIYHFQNKNTNDTIFLLHYIQKKINNLNLQNTIDYYFQSQNTIQFKKFIKKIISIFQDLLLEIPGVYCILFSIFNITIAIRDRYGNRPLCFGYNSNKDFYCISSESIAFPEGIEYKRDINPGEILLLYKKKCFKNISNISNNYNNNKIKNEIILESYFVPESKQLHNNMKIEPKFCIFEIIYFMKQNSLYRFKTVEYYRKKLSTILAKKEIITFPKDTIVCGVPSTAILFGETYAKELKLSYEQIFEKNKKSGRSFIMPTTQERKNMCKYKYIFHQKKIKNKNIILFDGSIVRGITLKYIISELKQLGANQIHVRVGSPRIISPCYYGVDFPTKNELIAHNKTNLEICDFLDIQSILYLDVDDIKKITNSNTCTSCFDDKHTISHKHSIKDIEDL